MQGDTASVRDKFLLVVYKFSVPVYLQSRAGRHDVQDVSILRPESVRSTYANTPLSTVQDVVMPLSNPIKGNDGTFMNEIPVPKGTIVTVGILASNCNEEIWGPDAHEWKPERWLQPLPQTVTDAHIPGIYSNL